MDWTRSARAACATLALSSLCAPWCDDVRAEGTEGSSAPAPYSLPWALRPAALPNVVRLDTALATSRDGAILATVLTGGVKVTSTLGLLARAPLVQGIEGSTRGAAIGNPLFAALYSPRVGDAAKVGLFVGVALPVGMGGGNAGSADSLALMKAAIPARSSMDNALFGVNHLTTALGASVAYVADGLTAQLESTLFLLARTRGEAVDLEPNRTNLTSGVHVGYALFPWLTPSLELRYQRWLSTPAAVAKDEYRRDTLTAALGLRGTWRVSEHVVLRPGVAYAEPIDEPMTGARYHIVHFDVPVVFP